MTATDCVRILCLADVHGKVDIAQKAVEAEAPDLIVLLGDTGAYWDSEVPVYAVLGNHEDWSLVDDILGGRRSVAGLTILPSGTTTTIPELGATAGALGGVSAERPRSRGHFTKDEVERLRSAGHVDLLLTHESPRPLWRGCTTITDLVAALAPKLSLSGHVHSPQIMRYEGTGTWLAAAPPVEVGHVIVTWREGEVSSIELTSP